MSCLEAANQVAVSLSHTYFTHMLYRHAAPQWVALVAVGVLKARHALLLGVRLLLGEVHEARRLLDVLGALRREDPLQWRLVVKASRCQAAERALQLRDEVEREQPVPVWVRESP